MSILSNEIKFNKSQTINNSGTNGGVCSFNYGGSSKTLYYTDNALNNIFPDVETAERTSGSTKYRKIFVKPNSSTILATSITVMLADRTLDYNGGTPSLSGTNFFIFDGSSVATQADIAGSERKYGCGRLNADVSVSGTTLVVNCGAGSAAATIFQNGDLIYISDGTNSEHLTINTAVFAGEQCTITTTTGLLNGYASATPTKISSYLKKTSVEPTTTDWTEISTLGTYNEGTYPLTLSKAAISEDWTVTFTSATAFTVAGATVGTIGTGTIAGDFEPNNPDFSLPYFSLLSAGWGGTWATNDTVTFSTVAYAIPVWIKRVVPASASAADYVSLDLKVLTVS